MVGLSEETTAARYSHRHTLDGRLQAAAQLLISVRDQVADSSCTNLQDELARRRLQVLASSTALLIDEVRRMLDAKRRDLDPRACPHCGWTRVSSLGTCPRCGKLRGAGDAGPDRRAPGALQQARDERPDPALRGRDASVA